MENNRSKIVITAIIGIVILGSIALLMKINGMLFAFAVAAVSGLGGYVIKSPFKD